MSTVIAAPFQQPATFAAQYHNMSNSPTQPIAQRNTRPPRARNVNINNDIQNTQSDSGLPSQATTPKPKKTRPRINDNRAASNSDVPKSTNPRPKAPHKSQSPTATPAKPAAYAGPTFHASPAASNLPMPKFASKSVPPVTTTNSMQAKLDAESTKLNAPSPSLDNAAPQQLSRERSPLDIFFNADRQERAVKSSPLAQRRTTPPEAKGMFKLDIDTSSSPAANRNQAEIDRQAYTQSLKNFLNLQPSTTSPAQPRAQPNPAFQTPQQQRTLDADPSLHYGNRSLTPLFHAARNPSSPQTTTNFTPRREPSGPAQQPFDPRAYLESQSPFVSRPQHATASPQQHHYQPPPYHSPAQNFGVPRPQPPPPQHASEPDYSPDVKGMEAKLKGMLKLT
ncbi:hypothetical protein E4T44_01818 [Aureobasidium sp. EXF-8845]|nr:hypothetical protein E4T44_01818 [Aureobasidium sp. EXF-8845]KAI4856940.1 hypothetical protein E4T45_01583 [Aureobasidium sp. EXF-8846]